MDKWYNTAGGKYCMSGVLAGWRAAEGGLAIFRRLMEVYVLGAFTTP